MRSVHGVCLTHPVIKWLADTYQPRILHIFDHACNLINERGEVLSIVMPQIGNGPFNLVVDCDLLLSEHLNPQSPISISSPQLTLGDLLIHPAGARLWNPRPNWERLHGRRDPVFNHLAQLPIANYRLHDLHISLATNASDGLTTCLQSLVSHLSTALANADTTTAKNISTQLAGLGIGLTPSGDDLIMGAIYAVWIIHPPAIASVLAKEVADTAAPLTTSLSAAWLRSAGRGEAGHLWHEFFDALISGDIATTQSQIAQLLSVGHTSGADALTGFMNTLIAWASRSHTNFTFS